MSGYSLYGVNRYPAGKITGLSYMRFRAMGKQWDLEPPYREPPLVLHTGVASLTLEGVVVTEPLTGELWTCTKVTNGYKGASTDACSTAATHTTVTRSVFVGTSLLFNPRAGVRAVVSHNVFFGGDECRTACPTTKMVTLAGRGNLTVAHNHVHGGYGGFRITAPCASFVASVGLPAWAANVALGNAVGFDLEDAGACSSLFLEGYRNSAGITANTPEVNLALVRRSKALVSCQGVALFFV
jgi:hypothetical protein